jgi:hypothetical protein
VDAKEGELPPSLATHPQQQNQKPTPTPKTTPTSTPKPTTKPRPFTQRD